jgi:hypothetical protein
MNPQSPPHTGAVTGVLELLAFLRDPGFASRRFAEMGMSLRPCWPDSPRCLCAGRGLWRS